MFDQSSLANKHFKRLMVHLDPGQPLPYQLKDKPCSEPTHFKNYKRSKILYYSPKI